MSRKTHEKELARARAKRQAERAAQQRTRRLVGAGVVVVVAIVAVVLGFALQGGDEPDPVATGDATAEPTDAATGDATGAPTEDASAAEPFAPAPPPMVIDPDASYTATIETGEGTIVVDLAAAEAPTTVNNFVALASAGYYEGVVFHRIQEGFVIQGGDPQGTGRGGPGYQFEDELSYAEQVVEDNDGQYPRGTLAMANAGPNTNGSQFFICTVVTSWLDGRHVVFGRVTDGMDVVRKIEALNGTPPSETVTITKSGELPMDAHVQDEI